MQQFRISNKNRTKLRLNVLLVLLLINFIAFVFITKMFLILDILSLSIFLGVNIVLIISILRIEFFEYDSSGEVISIRSFHPLFRQSEKRTEFPKNMLCDFWISQNYFGTTHLKIAVITSDSRKVYIKYKIRCCTRENMKNINNSFLKLKELNLNSI